MPESASGPVGTRPPGVPPHGGLEASHPGILRPAAPEMHYRVVTTPANPASEADDALDGLLRRFLEVADEKAMEELVLKTRPRLLAAARRIGDPQDAEDTVQAAYHALLRRGAAIQEGPVIAWLLTAVVRLAYRRKATRHRHEEIVRRLAPRDPEPGPEVRTAEAEEADAIRRAVLRLPAVFGDALVLHHLQGLGVAEVGILLEVPVSTVKARLRRGRALLRSRLPLSLHLAVLAVPWSVADSWHSLSARTPWAVGGVVKAKTATVMLAVVLGGTALIGTAAYTLLSRESAIAPVSASPGGTSVGRADARPATGSTTPSLHPLGAQEQATPEPGPPLSPPSNEGSGAPATDLAAARDGRLVPEAVVKVAKELGVPDEALKAAWEAFQSGARGEGGSGPVGRVGPEALEALRARGEDGFRAIVAILRGGVSASWIRDLVSVAWSPGQERVLIQLAEDPKVGVNPRGAALDSLSKADSQSTRDYLVERLSRETNAVLFWTAAGALAALHEPRGLEPVAAKIGRKEWVEPIRRDFFPYLVDMDPQAARRVLEGYLHDPASDLVVHAVQALARIDADLARTEAIGLLDGARGSSFDALALRTLRGLAGRPQEE